MALFVIADKEHLHEFEVKSTAGMSSFITSLENIISRYATDRELLEDEEYLQFIGACRNHPVEMIVDYIEVRGDLDFDLLPVKIWVEV